MRQQRHSRYSIVAIALHWLIAAAIILMVPLGWWMADNVSDPSQASRVFKAYQLHKSIGLTILVLSVLRVVWRFTHRFPPLPGHMPPWEKAAARASHFLLYAIILLMPLTGWIYVSAGWNAAMNAPFAVPTIWFGLFEWPHISFIADAADATRAEVATTAITIHAWMAWGAVVLVAIHVLAAIKHHMIDRDDVLTSMLPWPSRRRAELQGEN
jgi:cytochrome b561